jgi:hypothetical protein
MKLVRKEHVGAKLRKRYGVAYTRYRGPRDSRDVTLPRRDRLVAPLALKARA